MPLNGLKLRIEMAATRITRSLVAMVFLVLAIVFFSAGGWMALADWKSPLIATLTFGGISLVFAIIFFAMARSAANRLAAATPPPSPPRSLDGPALIEAFVAGVVEGMKRGSRGKSG